MKKTIRILTLLTLVIVSAAPSIAQLRYGFRFGGSFATPSLRNAKDYKLINRSGFSGGMMLEYTLPETGAAADIAVLFTRYSTRLEMPGGGRMSFGRNFIEVPLHLKYKFWLPAFSNTVAPVVYTGPSLMIKTDRVKDDSHMTTMRRHRHYQFHTGHGRLPVRTWQRGQEFPGAQRRRDAHQRLEPLGQPPLRLLTTATPPHSNEHKKLYLNNLQKIGLGDVTSPSPG